MMLFFLIQGGFKGSDCGYWFYLFRKKKKKTKFLLLFLNNEQKQMITVNYTK
jgi:hypothetical protein